MDKTIYSKDHKFTIEQLKKPAMRLVLIRKKLLNYWGKPNLIFLKLKQAKGE